MAQPRNVLVVDDEQQIRTALNRTLSQAGYAVAVASSGEEALALLERTPVQLVISDHHMPGLEGVDLLKLVRVRYPHIVRIMLTADPDPEIPVRSINESEVYRFIRKPWNASELRTILHFAFEVIDLEADNRRLIALIRKEKQARETGTPLDPLDLEAELMLLAEEEAADMET
jgi:two-component system NtrC family sensor kinase